VNKVIEISNFTKSFGSQKAVQNLSFDVQKGDIFAFLGSNGSGKTTTIRCLLNIYQPDQGSLEVFGKKYGSSISHEIGYLPEERGLYTKANLNDVFIYFAMLRGIDKSKAQKLTDEYLEQVGLLSDKKKLISQLSSGMQQKAQIGIAIIHKPKLLILDEPFKGLDPVNRELFLNIFTRLKAEGTSILYSTHVIDEAQKLSNRLIIIDKGQSKAYGTVKEVRESFGTKHIHIETLETVPQNNKLYSAKINGNKAVLMPNKDISTDVILKYLIGQNIKIINYQLDYPDLNEIFIKVTKNNE